MVNFQVWVGITGPGPLREIMMPNAHLKTLTDRHAQLETRLGEESRRPHPDQMHMTRLKREKLMLKEELSRQA
jgi:hypothetical protein